MGRSMEINCQLSRAQLNVTLIRRLAHSDEPVTIKPDGIKYIRRSNQTFLINNLDQDDGVTFNCRADGVSEKRIDLIVKPGMWQAFLPFFLHCLECIVPYNTN